MHTKLPWKRDAAAGLKCDARGPNGEKIFLCFGLREIKSREHLEAYSKEASANADLIVRAVNSHQALVDALRLVQAGLKNGAIKSKQIISFAYTDESLKMESLSEIVDSALALVNP